MFVRVEKEKELTRVERTTEVESASNERESGTRVRSSKCAARAVVPVEYKPSCGRSASGAPTVPSDGAPWRSPALGPRVWWQRGANSRVGGRRL